MQNFKIFLFLLISSLLISFTTKNQDKLKTGFYFLAETENEGVLIKDIDSEEVLAVERTELLTSKDFSSANFVLKNGKPNPLKVIELLLNKNGRKKWFEIQKRMSKTGESVLFIYNDRVYFEKRIIGKSMLSNSKIDLIVGSKYEQKIIETIKSEIISVGK